MFNRGKETNNVSEFNKIDTIIRNKKQICYGNY